MMVMMILMMNLTLFFIIIIIIIIAITIVYAHSFNVLCLHLYFVQGGLLKSAGKKPTQMNKIYKMYSV